MVDAPNRYRWSSVHGNLGSLVDPVLTPHDRFMALGLDDRARGDAYREWLQEAISDEGTGCDSPAPCPSARTR